MGVVSWEMETTSPVPAAKLFRASVLDADHIFPKILPEHFKDTVIIKGDGGAGTVKKASFFEGGQVKSITICIDALDKENLTYTSSIIEGEALKGILESITSEVKMTATPDGGTLCKNVNKYTTIGDAVIGEDQINRDKEQTAGLLKAVEAYLLANPDAC